MVLGFDHYVLRLIGIPLFVGLKPDHQREWMNLELHTDGRELVVVGCELNWTGHVCFLSGLQASDRDCELVDLEHELAVIRTEAEVV